jgi:signal peptide peptidase SppA
MKKPNNMLWAGSEQSLEDYRTFLAESSALIASGYQPAEDEGNTGLPRLLDIQGNLGIVSIQGPLISGEDHWVHEMYGVTSYGAIRDAVVAAADSPEVKQIVLDINSGGGAVNGVSDAGNIIAKINAEVKPVTTYSGGTMASAAYWLGSNAGEVYASDLSTVGSIGVLTAHKDISKALAADGVKVTVLRAGKYKALSNPYEPLSAEAEAQIQSQLDDAYKVFVGHVAQARGVSYDFADKNMAQGREFFGEKAKEAGLVDGILSFDELFDKIQAKILDNDSRSHQNKRNINHMGITTMKRALTTAQLAAMAEGVIPQAAAEMTEVVANAPATDPGQPAPAPTEPTESEAAETPAAQVQGVLLEAKSELVGFLQAQIKEKDAALLDAGVLAAKQQEQMAGLTASLDPMKAIVATSVNNMRLAMGSSAVDMTAMSASEVLAEHVRLTPEFKSKFKLNGVAAVSASVASAEKSEAPMDAFSQRMRNAVNSSKKGA